MKASYEEVVMLATRMQFRMIRELTKESNMNKTNNWLECDINYLIDKLTTHLTKLNIELPYVKHNKKFILEHTTHIANYAAMIADRALKEK